MSLKILNFFGDRGLRIVRGEAQYVWDSQGRKYVDFHTGHGAAFLGHRNPYVVREVTEQLNSIMTLTPNFLSPVLEDALSSLSRVAPEGFTYVALLNSGSEAVELALKVSVRYSGRVSFTAFRGAFHGRTLGALSITWRRAFREPFKELLISSSFAPYNDASGLDSAITEETAAVFLEPVQGEGGVVPAVPEFARAVARRASEVGALLVVDEVQSGFGRTGCRWGFERLGLKPDIVVAGKALGGGFPVSAVFLREEVAQALRLGDHGSTFGGNPLALAAVKGAVNAFIEDSVPFKAREAGRVLKEMLEDSLRNIRAVREVRGAGLMIGISLRFRASRVVNCLQSRGVLALSAGPTVLRFLPPYMIGEGDAEYVSEATGKCVRECYG
ncbi:MAG: aspartate aminotransferase family protein [Desulfurococcales archaeon]|nr:aspartate aminotransferase family protein [Desulfurococcales archaeon]